jgi:hypothetical protein
MEVKSMDDRIAFQAEIGEWEVRNQRLIDSLAGVKAARDQRYADNREKWNRPRRNTSPSKRTWPTRKAETVSIDYSIPMPALESVDANTVDTNVLFRMGVPPKIARRWVKFRERGGNFVRKEDIGKLYGMPDSTLNRILPYLKTPDLKEKRKRCEALALIQQSALLSTGKNWEVSSRLPKWQKHQACAIAHS